MDEGIDQEIEDALIKIAQSLEKLTRLGKISWRLIDREAKEIHAELDFLLTNGECLFVLNAIQRDEKGNDIDENGSGSIVGYIQSEQAKALYSLAETKLPPIF